MPTRAWMTLRNKGQFRIGFTPERRDRPGRDDRDRAPARARVRRARERRHALPAADRARRRDERRHGRAGVSARACAVGSTCAPRTWRSSTRRSAASSTRRRARRTGERLATSTWPARRAPRRRAQVARGVEAEQGLVLQPRARVVRRLRARAKSPEIAIVVLIEHGGAGGKHAAPVAMRGRARVPARSRRRRVSRRVRARRERGRSCPRQAEQP